VHDRRIDGQTYTFGNHGALWMNAMTWWDHETESIWTQPWGRALDGPLKGTVLRQIPAEIVPWRTWKADHPNTLALDWQSNPGRSYYENPTDRFVVGVSLADSAVAFPYDVVSGEGVVNADIGPYPVVVHANPETRASHVYLRTLNDGTVLTFTGGADTLVDDQTGSTWDPVYGLAIDGSLQGTSLRSVPYTSSFDWAWQDFYPHTTFYKGES
jgi:hypothetical protein